MDGQTKSCSLEEIAFKWMFHCGIVKSLHEQCQRYENESSDNKMREKRMYRIIFIIDVGELLDFDVQLGNVVCNQPEKGKEIFQEACFICIQTLNWIPEIMSKTQVDLQMRYLSIPRFISCSSVFALRRELLESGSRSMPLFCTVGIVSGMTSRVNYTQSTWFQCINNTCHSSSIGSGCAGYSNNPGGENTSGDMICISCGTPLEEDISCRILGEKCQLHIVSPDGLSHNTVTNANCRLNRSISVYVRDELINEVELGACYSFSLFPRREFYGGQNSYQLNLIFEANNVAKVNACPILSMVPQSLLEASKSKFCKIQKLYEDRKSSPWSFAGCLAYFFGDSITPPGTYFRLKLGLLLSLVSQQSLNDQLSGGHVHILTVCKDVLPIQRLLLYSRSFSKRSVVFSPCNDLCFSISKDQSNLGSCIIHGGCVLLASGGVCVLSNLNELKNDQVEELENVVQTECVNIDVPKKYIGCQQSQISVPVTCKIWACCEITKKQGTRSHNTYQNLQEYGQLSKTLVDYFSLVFVMTENEVASSEMFAETLIVQNILEKASLAKEQETNRIPENEFFQFLQYASANKPSFSNEARDLIQGFYLASRRTRSSGGVAGVEFPISALKSMMSLAEAHAKLNLRHEVSEDDAVMAILLYEESITARVGYSVLGVSPLHHFNDGNIMSYVGEENDEKMTHLKIHTKRFCSLHSNYKYIPGYIPHEE